METLAAGLGGCRRAECRSPVPRPPVGRACVTCEGHCLVNFQTDGKVEGSSVVGVGASQVVSGVSRQTQATRHIVCSVSLCLLIYRLLSVYSYSFC